MNLIAELKRRNVIRAAGLYLVGAWLVLQVAATLLPIYDTPGWVMKVLVASLVIAFVPAMVVTWVFELTPAGFKRDAQVVPADSIAPQTARRMDRLILIVAFAAIGYFAFDKFALAPRREATLVRQTTSHVTAEISAEKSKVKSRSIAVLPFVNMSADPENEFFSDGLSEEILNSLARIDGMQVVGRTSSFQFKGKNEDLRTIGDKLGVATVLEGSVRREGERARITAQLIRTSDGIHLWSETYDRTLKDSLAVQLDIAEQVAGVLDVVLDDKQRERMRSAGVKNVDAFIAYQKGWKLYERAHRDPAAGLIDTLRQANVEFARAAELDPGFSFAWYAQADMFEHLLMADGHSQQERLDAQRGAMHTLQRAAETSPDAQQRDLALAESQMLSNDWRGLPTRIEAAFKQPGCSAPNWIPVFAGAFGYGDLFADLGARVSACDPLNGINWNTRIWAARIAGKPQRALQILADAIQATGADISASTDRAAALMMLGRIDQAKAELDAVSNADRDERYQVVRAGLGRLMGEDPAAVHVDLGKLDRNASVLKMWAIADAVEAAQSGDRDEADRLASALDARPAGGFLLAVVVAECQCSAPFDVDATPNFKARLAESGLRWPPPRTISYPARKQAPSKDELHR